MLFHSLLPVLYSAYIQTISTVGISILTCYLSPAKVYLSF